MRLRRCAVLWFEPREMADFDLGGLLAGGTGVTSRMQWLVHAPQLASPLEADAGMVALLGAVGPSDWLEAGPLREHYGADQVGVALRAGLLVGRGKAWKTQREADERVRAQHWHAPAAIFHAESRWQGMDSVKELAEAELETTIALRARFGAPPPVTGAREDAGARIGLPRTPHAEFDRLLDARSTCRNFDLASELPLAGFARLLERVFGARATVRAAEDFDVLKKTSPSGGALHPTEAYLVVQRVAGIVPGLYHYHPLEHALRRLPWEGTAEELHSFAKVAVAGQHYLADAHVLVALSPRFARTFWKYRNHPKAYRVCVLDAGHLSQTLLLSATEQGLGAFVTAAINEVDIEQAFGLTGYVDGPLAVCGFGIRADTMTTSEFDPNRKVWK